MSLLIDIDDTLISTKKRTQGLWRYVLGCNVSIEEIETLTAVQIFERYATEQQKPRMRELQRLFTQTMLCLNDVGLKLMEEDEPIPYAVEVLNQWEGSKVYITGRLEHLRNPTLAQLRLFGFPVDDTMLYMFNEDDWRGGKLGEARKRILDDIMSKHHVIKVVDDFPGYFPVYMELGIPERIGLCCSRTYKPEDYLSRGATKVVESWKELQE